MNVVKRWKEKGGFSKAHMTAIGGMVDVWCKGKDPSRDGFSPEGDHLVALALASMGECDLIEFWDGQVIKGVAIIEEGQQYGKKLLLVNWVIGEDYDQWIELFLETLKERGREVGAVGAMATSRLGSVKYRRMYARHGFRVETMISGSLR